ncbi:fatty acid alpha-hydroxylase [Puccinia graminis f. sp. tritici]|uniref:Fatty acid alpha-hydroxylase n=1 Tax=Puccinia graminis f. sp. tritici TaxID=56615 RepID=A0A5B0LNX1_PUCGR|nr:fatty acid alpha-hydroxylase [Puccinia graminis f. sp. tritici]
MVEGFPSEPTSSAAAASVPQKQYDSRYQETTTKDLLERRPQQAQLTYRLLGILQGKGLQHLVSHPSHSLSIYTHSHSSTFLLSNSSFLADHPGGDELLLQYAGRDLGEAMDNPDEHTHSKSAYEMLEEFQIGIIGTPETILNPNLIIDDDFKPTTTDITKDHLRNQFLDLSKPLIPQMWNCQFSRAFYLQQVHQPRHLSRPARLFGPWYLEMFTRTSWYVVPLIWLPIAFALFHRALQQQLDQGNSTPIAWSKNIVCFLFGNLVWTFLEYILHRFLFHIDDVLPDRPFFLLLHFLLHGVHHYLPMDRLRLVMPPILFATLSHPFTRLAYFLFPVPYANAVISGAFTFYVLYDCTHYALHHTQLPKYVKEMKIYHMATQVKDQDYS